MDGYTIAWSISLIGVLVNVVGGIWFVSALRGIGGVLKKSQLGILGASMIWLSYSVLMIVLAFKRVPMTEPIWFTIPIAYTVTAITFMAGTYKLMNALKEIS
jgi:hypothetical protein